jgi:hypothetical protein
VATPNEITPTLLVAKFFLAHFSNGAAVVKVPKYIDIKNKNNYN